jgi:hypothetical protein
VWDSVHPGLLRRFENFHSRSCRPPVKKDGASSCWDPFVRCPSKTAPPSPLARLSPCAFNARLEWSSTSTKRGFSPDEASPRTPSTQLSLCVVRVYDWAHPLRWVLSPSLHVPFFVRWMKNSVGSICALPGENLEKTISLRPLIDPTGKTL